MKLKILITTGLNGFFNFGKLYIGPLMVLGYLIFEFESWNGFTLFSRPFDKEFLYARGATASIFKKQEVFLP